MSPNSSRHYPGDILIRIQFRRVQISICQLAHISMKLGRVHLWDALALQHMELPALVVWHSIFSVFILLSVSGNFPADMRFSQFSLFSSRFPFKWSVSGIHMGCNHRWSGVSLIFVAAVLVIFAPAESWFFRFSFQLAFLFKWSVSGVTQGV